MHPFRSEQTDKLFEALCAAQKRFKKPAKSGKNPHFKSTYSTMEDIWEAVHEALNDNQLSFVQLMSHNNGSPMLCTLLGHNSGQWLLGESPIIMKEQTAQAYGSATTYAKRQSLSALIGMGCDDGCEDDGEQATVSKPAVKRGAVTVAFTGKPSGKEAIAKLAKRLEQDEIDTTYLEDYIQAAALKQSMSVEDAVKSSLEPSIYPNLAVAFGKYSQRRACEMNQLSL